MNIPLTIQHSKEDLPYFTMSEVSLLALNDIEFEKMLQEILRIKDDWIKNKRCRCSKHPDIQNKRLVLDCKHIKKVINSNKIIQEADKKTSKITSALIYRNLNKFAKTKLSSVQE